jgi:NitT/TauT family transport system permease protein
MDSGAGQGVGLSEAGPTVRPAQRRSIIRRVLEVNRAVITPTLALIGLLILWEIVVRVFDIPRFLLPAPSAVLVETVERFDLLMRHAQATVYSTLIGFVLSVLFGIALSMLIVWSRTFEDAVYPLVVMTQVIPKVAIAPLLIVYLGFGQEPKIFLAFLVSFFPMVINTTLGMKSVSVELLELLATLKANRWQVMTKVRFRRAMPYMVEGAKIAITLAVIGAIVGEFSAGGTGLGYLILSASSNLDTTLGFSALFVLIVVGVILFEIIHVGGRLLMPWAPRTTL